MSDLYDTSNPRMFLDINGVVRRIVEDADDEF
jgi:hypothetical protein